MSDELWGLGLPTRAQLQVAQQDALDGAALRRLREALPTHVITVKADAMAYGHQWLVSAEDGPERAMYALESTIAEAADKCREALKRPDDTQGPTAHAQAKRGGT